MVVLIRALWAWLLSQTELAYLSAVVAFCLRQGVGEMSLGIVMSAVELENKAFDGGRWFSPSAGLK